MRSYNFKIFKIFVLLLSMGLGCSDVLAQSYTWNNVVILGGGYVSGVDYSPVSQGLLYARTDMGGLYRWDNFHQVWIPLTDFLGDWNLYGGESIAPDPVNADNVYAAVGETYNNTDGYILASSNQGDSWTQYSIPVFIGGNNDGRNAGERLAVDPNSNNILYFASRSNGLWKSTDSAAVWNQAASFPVSGDAGYGLSWVIFLPGGNPSSGAETLFVGAEAMNSGNSNLYCSVNAGVSWALVPGGPVDMVPPHASLGTDGNLWIAYDGGGYGPNGVTRGQVWKLNTSTLAWTQLTLPGPPTGKGGYGGICVDPENAQHVVVSTLDWWSGPDHIYMTSNGGVSWSVIGNMDLGWNSGPYENYDPTSAQWAYFCGSRVSGLGWESDVKIDPFNSNNAVYNTGGGVWASANINASAVTWTFTNQGLEQTAQTDMTSSAAGGVLFSAMGDISGMRHTNLGQSPSGGMYCNPEMSTTDAIDYAELNPNIVAREGHGLSVSSQAGGYSTNNGVSWTPFATNPTGYSTGNPNGVISVAADGSAILWAVPGYPPAYSTNYGASWTGSTGLSTGVTYQTASDRVNGNIFYCVSKSGNTLYVSANGGVSFSAAGTYAGRLSSNRPRAVFGIAGEVWVPTQSGLYRFTNVGLGPVTTTQIANVSGASAVGFGISANGAPPAYHPAVYLGGTVNGTYGFYRNDDGTGASWTRINDANHQYGGAEFAEGDETVYGRMYIGTNGRGILYGDIYMTPTSTPTPTPTPYPCGYPGNTCTPTPTHTFTSTPTPTKTFLPLPDSRHPLIYPNPLRDQSPLQIFVPFTGTADVTVKVFTTTFRMIGEKTFRAVPAGESVELSTNDSWGKALSNGLYYIVVTTSQGIKCHGKWLVLR